MDVGWSRNTLVLGRMHSWEAVATDSYFHATSKMGASEAVRTLAVCFV